MTDREATIEALGVRAERRESRRAFFTAAMGAAAAGAGAFAFASAADAQAVTDQDILNFALNLEYLEANYYAFAVNGSAIASTLTSGSTTAGAATGGRKVTFTDPVVGQYAREIAADELAHVSVLRSSIGTTGRVAQPAIDLGTGPTSAFSLAAQAAGLVAPGSAFDPYASDENFLLGAFLLEDVGVSAYKGAGPLISNVGYRQAAASILAAEAYHAGLIRSTLYRKGIATPALVDATEAISAARDSLDGGAEADQGIRGSDPGTGLASNIVPTDDRGAVFGRTTGQVLNIVYLNRNAVSLGGFFPSGVNGTIKTSAAN